MLSYRHAFHAGNHAHVLKHLLLIQLGRYLGQKEKPFWIIDTHAGAGLHALDSDYASKLREFESGIGKLWTRKDLPHAPRGGFGLAGENKHSLSVLPLHSGAWRRRSSATRALWVRSSAYLSQRTSCSLRSNPGTLR